MKKFKSLTGRFGLFRGVLTFLAISFGVSSCTPDFDLDKKFPEWLGTSIYETLSEGFDGHTFNYYVRLIDALDQKNILSKTGSRTLFVADDVAFQKFLDKCPIAGNKAVRFEDLSKAQLKMILKGSMLNNVFQVASLSSTSTENGVRLGDCMRRVSTMSEYDSVRVIKPEDMPRSSYWDYLRNNPNRQAKGAIVLEDGTKKPLIFFAPEFLQSRKITDDDYNFLFNLDKYSKGTTKPGRLPKDASVNGVRIAIQNKKCFNGFIHVMEDVVYLLPSMAEYLAQVDADGKSNSKIYSSIIERFSAPFYASNTQASDNDHTGNGNAIKINQLIRDGYYGPQGGAIADALEPNGGGRDSVFTKLYFSSRFQGTDALTVDPQRKAFDKKSLLKFDPGWNSYFISSSAGDDVALQEDMAAMFVPTDAAIMDWWINSAQGQEMRKTYGILKSDPAKWDADSVALDMSEIDKSVIVQLVNNNMFNSFTSTVPSKFKDLLNDAQDHFFTDASSAVDLFDEVVMCCNGAIFFSNKVFVPTAYKAVLYPALVNNRLEVLNSAIWDSDMQFFYYLNSMASAYCLFLPEYNYKDELETPLRDKLVWVDPASFALNKLGTKEDDYESDSALIALAFYWDDNAKTIKADYYSYDVATNSITGAKLNTTSITNQTFLQNRLRDFLDYHIILLKNKNYYAMEGGITPDENGYAYFRTKGGGAVRFKSGDFGDANDDINQLEVAGGWQIETKQSVGFIKRFDMRTVDGNGITYVIDKPIQTSRKSVYDILSDTKNYPEFEEFFKLMDGSGLFLKEYGSSKSQIGSQKCVSTFNTYNYTVYVPDNNSISDLLKAKVIYDPLLLDKWESNFDTIWTDLQDLYFEKPALCDAAWRDSVINFYQSYYGKDIMTTADSVILKYAPFKSGDFNEYDAPLQSIKENFIYIKREQLLNFLKYHIQDNSVYTNAEFNRGSNLKFSTAYLNKNRQYAKLIVNVGDEISVTDEMGKTHNVVKKTVSGVPYYNIMCREYVFKKYNDSYSDADDSQITGISTTKLETSSYAVIHLIDGALCNGEVEF